MSVKYSNYCIKGNCSNCGNCCTEFLPLTKSEVNLIKAYVKEKKIKPYSEVFFNYEGKPSVNLMCPFRDFEEKKCKIYTVRPKICRVFKCNQSQTEVEVHKLKAHRVANYNRCSSPKKKLSRLYSTRELIYGNSLDTIKLLVGNILRERQFVNVEDIKSGLINLGREDLADEDMIKSVLNQYKEQDEKAGELNEQRNS